MLEDEIIKSIIKYTIQSFILIYTIYQINYNIVGEKFSKKKVISFTTIITIFLFSTQNLSFLTTSISLILLIIFIEYFILKSTFFYSLIISCVPLSFTIVSFVLVYTFINYFFNIDLTIAHINFFNYICVSIFQFLIVALFCYFTRNIFYSLNDLRKLNRISNIKLIILINFTTATLIIILSSFLLGTSDVNIIHKLVLTNLLLFFSICILFLYSINKYLDKNIRYIKLKELVHIDEMTGTFIRSEGLYYLNREIKKCRKLNSNLILCFIDINNLKEVNDTYGHEEGDWLIKIVCTTIQKYLRKSDIICRFGGDEFLIVFPDCNILDSKGIWKRITSQYQKINRTSNKPYKISVSCGFSQYNPNEHKTLQELINSADKDMYKNKISYKKACSN